MSNNPELDAAYEWDKARGGSIYRHAIEVARLALLASKPRELIETMTDGELIGPEGWAAINGLVLSAYRKRQNSGITLGSVPGTVNVSRRLSTSEPYPVVEHVA